MACPVSSGICKDNWHQNHSITKRLTNKIEDAVKGLLRAQASVNDDAEVQEFLHDSDEEGDSNCVYEGAAGGTMTTAIE